MNELTLPTFEGRNMRNFDIIVWGATGFTGCLVCEHLLRLYQVSLTLLVSSQTASAWKACNQRELSLSAGETQMGVCRSKQSKAKRTAGKPVKSPPSCKGEKSVTKKSKAS